jgi:UDP-glucose 4-epimerase
MKILVTGGAGFIGSHLVEELAKDKKNSLIILDNLSTGRLLNIKSKSKNINFKNYDISVYSKKFENFFSKIDVVFHLAALADIVPSINDPLLYYKTNVTGTINVLNACKVSNVSKVVYAASASCYGTPKKYPTSESSEISLNYPYALTKKIGEDLLLHWSKVYKLNCTSLRLFNVYGPRSRTSGTYGAVFGVFLAQKINNQPLTVVGNGNQTRDFIYVKDVVRAFISASKFKKSSEIFNIGSGKQTTVNFIANKISKNQVYIPKRPGEPDRSQANISKAIKLLKWKPVVNINEGIKVLLKNINYWKNAPVWNPQSIKQATKIWFKYLN